MTGLGNIPDDIKFDICDLLNDDINISSIYALSLTCHDWHGFYNEQHKYQINKQVIIGCDFSFYRTTKKYVYNLLFNFFNSIFIDEIQNHKQMFSYVLKIKNDINKYSYKSVNLYLPNFNIKNEFSYEAMYDTFKLKIFLFDNFDIYSTEQFIVLLNTLNTYDRNVQLCFKPIINLYTSYFYSLIKIYQYLYNNYF